MSNPNPYAVLKLKEFRLFITARVCVTMAMQIQAVVVGWQMYELTKDPLSLGLIGLAEAIPSIGVSLYAGHVADVVQRKKIITITLVALACCSLSLLSFTTDPGAFVFQWGAVPLYVIIF